jgi:hypothetical protein
MKDKGKIIGILIALIAIIIICVGMLSNSNETDGSISENETAAMLTISEGKLGDYEVEIVKCDIKKDNEGKFVAQITYNFTNNSTYSTSFDVTINDIVYQDGIEAERAYTYDIIENEKDNGMKDIKPGASIEVVKTYSLNDMDAPIEVELTEYISLTGEKVTKIFDIWTH